MLPLFAWNLYYLPFLLCPKSLDAARRNMDSAAWKGGGGGVTYL